tara:strand:+ start:1710 stop:2366 length:657 start_codon:yes stop_codon:yes gene_type:complete
MTIGVIVFPGSNCDRDVQWATEGCLGMKTKFLWHETTDLQGIDAVVIPGGFSYGDYLRCGAIAQFAPVLRSVLQFVNRGGKVLGICNGFQVLTELGLLPGALIKNKDQNFICQNSHLLINSSRSDWFINYKNSTINIQLPIAHGEGRYFCSQDTLLKLQDDDCIALKYLNNPNGSLDDIAGLTNKAGNVLGLMPHPERACDPKIGRIDGRYILQALLN